MQYGNTTIVTPYDNDLEYDADWRSAFAMASLDYPKAKILPVYHKYRSDSYIQAQIEYLRAVQRGTRLTTEQECLRLASTWFQNTRTTSVKFRLEPLLLTPVGMDIIQQDLGGKETPLLAFLAYEKLYFAVRNEDFTQKDSIHARNYFAMPSSQLTPATPIESVWRLVGALHGYDTLVLSWGWSQAHGLKSTDPEYLTQELWRAAQSSIFMDLFAGRVPGMFMPQLLTAVTNQTRMRRETGGDKAKLSEQDQTMYEWLQLARPVMAEVAKSVDTDPNRTLELKGRLAIQQRINKQSINDAGPEVGVEKLNTIIANGFKTQKAEA